MLKSPEWISNSYNFILLLKGRHASNKTQSLSMLCCSDVIRYISKATNSFFKLKEVTEVLNLKLICFHINIIQVHHSIMVLMTYPVIHEAYCKKGLYQKSSRSAIYKYRYLYMYVHCKNTNSSSTIILFVPSEHLNKRPLFLGTVFNHYIFKFELAENLAII